MQMDPSTLPSQTDLNSLMGSWNPMSYMQGFQNQDLANQFRQQSYQANANTVDKGTLENQLSAATQPSDIALKQQAVDRGDIANQSAGLDLASKQDTYQDKQSLLHQQIARESSDEDLLTESNKIAAGLQQAKLKNDPDAIDKYQNAMDTVVGAMASKAADRVQARQMGELKSITDLQLENRRAASNEAIAAGNVAGRQSVADTHAQALVNAKMISQSLGQTVAYLDKITNRTPEQEQQLTQSRRDLATANAAVQNMVDLQRLTGGAVTRTGDRPDSASSGGSSNLSVEDKRKGL
jgi:hypothetical protein